ncbi:MAG: hypothetical protein DLM69_00705 [Candidatus Chloroheliales bacterium]|nr:MAG: hypothetical protein DLM69_00705 [Chloroflexota bacterium]
MDAISLLRMQMESAAWYLEGTMTDVTPELAHAVPPGKAHTIAGYYAHYVIMTDMIVNAMLKGGAPLFATTWADKTGVSEPIPNADADWEKNHAEWARRVQVDLPAMREYAKAVYASADEYLASLTPEALDQKVKLFGGEFGLGWAINMFIINHISSGTGEISAVKGVLGAKGFYEG